MPPLGALRRRPLCWLPAETPFRESAGIPQDQAVAAVLIQRFFTAYLPPVWGWFTLAWMRRREDV